MTGCTTAGETKSAPELEAGDDSTPEPSTDYVFVGKLSKLYKFVEDSTVLEERCCLIFVVHLCFFNFIYFHFFKSDEESQKFVLAHPELFPIAATVMIVMGFTTCLCVPYDLLVAYFFLFPTVIAESFMAGAYFVVYLKIDDYETIFMMYIYCAIIYVAFKACDFRVFLTTCFIWTVMIVGVTACATNLKYGFANLGQAPFVTLVTWYLLSLLLFIPPLEPDYPEPYALIGCMVLPFNMLNNIQQSQLFFGSVNSFLTFSVYANSMALFCFIHQLVQFCCCFQRKPPEVILVNSEYYVVV